MTTTNTDKARRKEWQVHSLHSDMMSLLEASGGELTPEVEALEARVAESAQDLAELGASTLLHARAMQDAVAAEVKRLGDLREYFRRIEGLSKRWLRIAGAELGDKFEAGTRLVRLQRPPARLAGGPPSRSDGWVVEGGPEVDALADLGLAEWGIRPDRRAILAEIKKGAEVLDYAVEVPAEKVVVVK